MSNFTKKIVAIATALSVSVMAVGPVGAATIEELQALIASLTAQLASLTTQLNAIQGGTTGGTITGCTVTSFTRNLSQGMSGDDVKCLQIIFNTDAATQVAVSGVGSAGNETNYFGPLTKAAAVKFQENYMAEVLTPVGLTAGTGYVGPSTRAKLNTMFGSEGVITPVPTANTVSLSTDTPGASAVAAGAQDVSFTNITFTAGSQAYTVTAISVLRGGISLNSNVSNVKLYDGATQIGSTQALNSITNKGTFSNLSWIIPANTAKTLTVKGSIAAGAGAGNSIVLGISASTDITASAAFTGTFPINGNARTVATQAVGSTTIDMLSTPADSSPISGSIEQHVATLQLTTSATEGFNFNSIKITNVGTAGNADISNIKLKYGATLIGTVASLTNGAATFTGNPLINVPVNTSKNLDIYIDVASGINTARTIQFEVSQAADIVAIGQNSGGQITVLAAGFGATSSVQTISQGSMTIASDAATNPSAQTYVVGTTGRNFGAIRFSAGATEGVRVTQITLTLGGTASASDISNVSLYDGATLIAGPSGISGSTVQFGINTVNGFDATGLFDIAKSTNKVITVKADISSGATAAATGTLSITAATAVKADGLSSFQDVPSTGITGTFTGNAMTVGANGSLAVALDSTSPAAQTVAKGGSTEVVLAAYSLTAGSGEDIAVSTMIVRLWRGTGIASTSQSGDITNVSIWDGGTQLGTTVSAPAGSATFNSNLTVPAGTKKIVTVKGIIPTGTLALSLHANLSATTTGDMISTGVSSLASITETGSGIGNLMTIGTPSLAVVAATVPIAATKVANTAGVQMATLLLTAGTAENVTVNTVRVSFAATDTLTGTSTADTDLSNVKLMDGATQVGSTMQIVSGSPDYVLFTGLSLIVPAGTAKALAVIVDIAGSSGDLYAGQAASADITGAGSVSGTSVSSTGGVAVSTTLTLSTGGTLAVAVSAATPLASNISVGSTQGKAGVTFSTFKFTTGIEGVKISHLEITRSGGADANFGAIYLYDGSTLLGTTYIQSATATFDFTAGNEIQIGAASTKDITVKADLMGLSTGATHAAAPKFYIATTTTDIVSVGASSQGAIAETVGTPDPTDNAQVNAMTLYRTTASIALIASSDIDPGAFMEVMRVNITNNGLYDLTVTSFDVTPTFAAGSASLATSSATASTTLTWLDTPATTIATGLSASTSATKITISPTGSNTVAAGQTRTLIVKADSTGLTTIGNSFRMDLTAIADFGWNPYADGEVVTLTPGMPIIGQTFTR